MEINHSRGLFLERGGLLIILQIDAIMRDDDPLIRAPGSALGDLPNPLQIFLPNCDFCHFPLLI
ncbi:hypothetical protein ACVWZR_004410 [Bradyrhizobium sp. i1.3.1]